jgi:hypothetical protein
MATNANTNANWLPPAGYSANYQMPHVYVAPPAEPTAAFSPHAPAVLGAAHVSRTTAPASAGGNPWSGWFRIIGATLGGLCAFAGLIGFLVFVAGDWSVSTLLGEFPLLSAGTRALLACMSLFGGMATGGVIFVIVYLVADQADDVALVRRALLAPPSPDRMAA